MIARCVAILVGSAILAAVTHVTVLYTGGYGSSHSYVVIAVAAGVGTGSVFYNQARDQGRYVLALCLLITMSAGEAFGLYQTTSRLVAASQAQQAPLREYAEAHAKAKADVGAADNAAKVSTSLRLTEAIAAKEKADKAVTDNAKEVGCRGHCKDLLQNAVDKAALEIANARVEIAANKAKAETDLATAKTTLAGMKAPESATPLADLTGVAAWKLDLGSAIVGSMGGNGLACCILIFGAHGRRKETPRQPLEQAGEQPEPRRKGKIDTPRRPELNASAREHAAQFALARLSPNGAGAELAAIRQEYRDWSAMQPQQLSDAEIGLALAKLFDEAGIAIADDGGQLVAVGVSLKETGGKTLVLSNP